MNSTPTVTEAAAFLEAFRAAVEDFAAREAELRNQFQGRLEAAARRKEKQAQSREEERARAIAAEQARFIERKQQLEQRQERRNTRITRAHGSALKKEQARIEEEEGRRKYAVQKGTLDAQRAREEGIRNADAALAEMEARIGEEETRLANLEHDAWKAFRGYGTFRKALAREWTGAEEHATEQELTRRLTEVLEKGREELAGFQRFWAPAFFRTVPFWVAALLIIVAGIGLQPVLQQLGVGNLTREQIWMGSAVALVVLIAAYLIGRHRPGPLAGRIADRVVEGRSLAARAREEARGHRAREIERIERESNARHDELQREWNDAVREGAEERELAPKLMEKKRRRAVERNQSQHEARLAALQRRHEEALNALSSGADVNEAAGTGTDELAQLRAAQEQATAELHRDWKATVSPLLRAAQEANAKAVEDFPPWDDRFRQWSPPGEAKGRAKFGELSAQPATFCSKLPEAPELRGDLPATIALPLLLKFPEEGSLLFETAEAAERHATGALNNLMLRLLATFPAGKMNMTLIDPVKLGENFAAILHLGDYEQDLINGRIWTQPGQIEEQLGELNEHIEKVIQMYLRNEYETIGEYNAQAGNIAEKYRFLVIADFPHNFSESAVRTLLRIISSGPRCGVYTFMHWDQRQNAPLSFVAEEFRKQCVCLKLAGDQFVLSRPALSGATVKLDAPPEPGLATDFLHRVGQASVGASRVTVPFSQVTPNAGEEWSLHTGEELRVPIGRSGAAKLQYLALGKGTRQHVLIAGKTGSGKSTLLHVMITNLALWAPPEEVEFYLVDFKRGVEFKDYATQRLPHARVVAIESDREFGLSVLQRVDEELKRRGEIFREAGVQDINGYRNTSGAKPMPRSLLVIDEFQEFFVEEDRIGQAAAVLLDRIVRQGRAFGIHVVLGSQTLGGAYTLARSTMGQMVVRIALQCNEADSYLIMDESNPAPRLLSRPGEGIYNDMAGNIEGNSPFQTVWLSPEEREQALGRVRDLARARGGAYATPVVFEGNSPADPRENDLLRRALLEHEPRGAARIWLGAPNSIKGPTEVRFEKRSGSNLLVVGQREEAALALVTIALATLNALFDPGSAEFVVCSAAGEDTPARALLDRIAAKLPQPGQIVNPGSIETAMAGLGAELQRRTTGGAAPKRLFLVIHEFQHFRKLRAEDEFSFSLDESGAATPAQQLTKLLSEGPPQGMHVLATIDTATNVNRFLGRKGLGEFDMRVLFQMSAQDSAALCDDPKASTLGLHRAVLYNEQQGSLETFRPYALPPRDWWDEALRSLENTCGRK